MLRSRRGDSGTPAEANAMRRAGLAAAWLGLWTATTIGAPAAEPAIPGDVGRGAAAEAKAGEVKAADADGKSARVAQATDAHPKADEGEAAANADEKAADARQAAEEEWTKLTAQRKAWLRATNCFKSPPVELEERLLAAAETAFGPDDPRTATELTALGRKQVGRGQAERAIPLLRRAETIRSAAAGPDDPAVDEVRHVLAGALVAVGRAAEGETMLVGIIARLEKIPAHRMQRADAAADLADLYRDAGRHAEAVPLRKQVHEFWERTYPKGHSRTLDFALALADAHRQAGDDAAAEAIYLHALKSIPEDDCCRFTQDQEITSLLGLADIYRIQGRYASAEPRLRLAASIATAQRGPNDARTISVLEIMEKLYMESDRPAEAERVRRDIAARRAAQAAEDSPAPAPTPAP